MVALSRRNFLMPLAATVLGAVGLGMVWRGRSPAWARGPKLRDGHPILRMPFPAGMAVLCQQGNASPPGRTHSGGNCLYALDLSNIAEDIVDVVAAASGRVSYVYGDSMPGESNAGLRFGNQVKVEHGEGYFTFYSHLDRIVVREGDVVRNGDPLGTMGSTGAAGNRHLHFSLHHGVAKDMGVGDTMPMRALVTANLSHNFIFQSLPGNEFVGGEGDLWNGRIYGSENIPDEKALDCAPRDDLRERLRTTYAQLRIAVDHRILLDDVAQAWEANDIARAQRILPPILEHTPRHAVARYWFGTAVHMVQREWDVAERLFDDLLKHGMNEPTWEMWLRSWIHNRMGVIAIERHDPDAASSHFAEALKSATAGPEREFARDHLKQLRPHE